jgi:hypothetical protein
MSNQKLTDDVINQLAEKYLYFEEGVYGGIRGEKLFAKAIEAYLNNKLEEFEYQPCKIKISESALKFLQLQKY